MEVTDKLDGSLGIAYHHPDGDIRFTRGAFGSEQAVEGQATEFSVDAAEFQSWSLRRVRVLEQAVEAFGQPAGVWFVRDRYGRGSQK